MLLFLLLLMLLLLFLPRSLLLLLLLGFISGPTAKKPFRQRKTFRNCGQSTFSACSIDAASAPQGDAFPPSAICCATTR